MEGTQNETSRQNLHPIGRRAAVLAGALLMTWPALYNRYPLLYPDSMSYLEDGPLVARAIFLRRLSRDYGGRSFIYCLGILPLHWNVTSWPIVAFNALLTGYVLWLVVRSILPRQVVSRYLIVVVLLSLLTSLGWFASAILPDIFGPVLYLCIYLLVFARETLSRAERLTVILVAWWAVASHVTHLMLAAGMCILLGVLLVLRRGLGHRLLKATIELAAIVVVAVAAHLALHAYLYGKPSLNGKRLPYLMARVIGDGPGRWYLEQNCDDDLKLVLCEHVEDLPVDADDFLWTPDGIWQTASEATKQRLRDEEIPFVLATLRTYPRQELSAALVNFWHQLMTFDLSLFHPNDWVLKEFDKVLPDERSSYLYSREAHDRLPYAFFTSVQNLTVIASLLVIGVFTPRMWCLRPTRLGGLSVVIVSAVVANAFVTGTLSMVENRFQSRVIWLLPLLACLWVMDWLSAGKEQKAA